MIGKAKLLSKEEVLKNRSNAYSFIDFENFNKNKKMITKNSTAAKEVERRLNERDGLYDKDPIIKRPLIITILMLVGICLMYYLFSIFN